MNKGLIFNKYGSLSNLSISRLPRPLSKKGTAIIRIGAFGLNPRDLAIIEGKFRVFTGNRFPKLIGADFAGEVVALPKNEEDFKVGDKVFGYYDGLRGGVSAEFVQVPIKYLVRRPIDISDVLAASLGCTYLTAYQALVKRAKLKIGQKVLIYGASGGVGTAAIQLAKNEGAIVTAVSHSKNRIYCMEQGADNFLAYDLEDVFSIRERFDVFLQVFSENGSLYPMAKRLVHDKGIFIGLIPDPFTSLFGRFKTIKEAAILVKSNRADLEKIANMVDSGVLSPHLDKVFEIKEHGKAFGILKNGSVQGKIVISLK